MRTISEADIHAVVGSVDAAAFGESSIAGMLGDLADLEPIGRAHHEVVATIAAESPVVPLRLATIYPDDDTVSALLAEHHAELTELLESLRGTQEWGVQVYLRPAAGEAVPAGVTARVSTGGSAGRDGGGSTGPQQPWLEAEASADQIDRVLSDIAVVSRRQPAPLPAAGLGLRVDGAQRHLSAGRRPGRRVRLDRAAVRGRARHPAGGDHRPVAAVLVRRPGRRLTMPGGLTGRRR